MSGWDPVTRGINYDKNVVVQRLKYYARLYDIAGDTKNAKMLRSVAGDIELGVVPPSVGAKLVLSSCDELE